MVLVVVMSLNYVNELTAMIMSHIHSEFDYTFLTRVL